MTGNTQKIGAIIIYLDILFTRDHFPAWLGTWGERERRRGGGMTGEEGGGEGRREGGPQGFGDSWHERGREKETGRRSEGRQERDNVMSVFEISRIFMTSIYLRLHRA